MFIRSLGRRQRFWRVLCGESENNSISLSGEWDFGKMRVSSFQEKYIYSLNRLKVSSNFAEIRSNHFKRLEKLSLLVQSAANLPNFGLNYEKPSKVPRFPHNHQRIFHP
jgi:hypothetical protein